VGPRRQGVSYISNHRQEVRAGILPFRPGSCRRAPSLVDGPPRPGRTVLYARVSSTDQREDLGRQGDRFRKGAADWGLQTREVVTEVGSGPNGRHPQVDPAAPGLPRGARLLEAALLSSGRRIGVIDPEEVTDDLVQGMYEVLTSLCARL